MVMSGFGLMMVTGISLIFIGEKLHDNYEYYAQYGVLWLGPAVIGFWLPVGALWWRERVDGKLLVEDADIPA